MSSDQWDPEVYRRFEAERDRPALDLLALLEPTPGGTAVDLGCGDGHLTARLTEHLGARAVRGIDASAAMLDRAARFAGPRVSFVAGDLARWGSPGDPGGPAGTGSPSDPHSPNDPGGPVDPASPGRPNDPTGTSGPSNPHSPNDPTGTSSPSDPHSPNDPGGPVDVVFANASLQWVPDHAEVLARWTAALAPGGQLAVQVPTNAGHESHRTAVEVAAEPAFAAAFAPHGGPPPDPVATNVLSPRAYAELLVDLGYESPVVRLQVYGPVLPSTAAVADWMRGTSLTRFRRLLDGATFERFVARYTERLVEVVGDRRPYYFAFERILLWARRPA